MTQGVYRHRQNKSQKNIPGRAYLRKPDDPIPHRYRKRERCACPKTLGHWMVMWGRQLYEIVPATQLQRDIWLGEAMRKLGKEKALACLRWYCAGCGIAQLP